MASTPVPDSELEGMVRREAFAEAQAPARQSAFEVLDALDGFFILGKRSSTLEGSAPVKAVQFCTPFIQGNAAGFQLWFGDSTLLRRGRHDVILGFTEATQAKLSGDYDIKVERLVERGFLARRSYWHKKLAQGAYWQAGNRLHVWTGHLVRPAPDVWLLVSGAFNRRCPIDVEEHVIPGETGFVPLIVTLDLDTVRATDTWLEKEVACVLPMRPDVTFTSGTLEEAPDLGRSYVDYFDERWDTTGPGNYLGAYRKFAVKESSDDVSGGAACRAVVAGGSALHRFGTFKRFVTSRGWSNDHPKKDRLQFVDVRNLFDVEGLWDGHAIRELVGETPQAVRRLRDTWRALYGEVGLRAVGRFLEGYVRSTHGPRIGEPYLTFTPWLFVTTPPGWSSVLDAVHFDGLDGLRGVISTDHYHSLFEVWQLNKTVRFEIPRGAKLMRALPVPRGLLKAKLETVTFD